MFRRRMRGYTCGMLLASEASMLATVSPSCGRRRAALARMAANTAVSLGSQFDGSTHDSTLRPTDCSTRRIVDGKRWALVGPFPTGRSCSSLRRVEAESRAAVSTRSAPANRHHVSFGNDVLSPPIAPSHGTTSHGVPAADDRCEPRQRVITRPPASHAASPRGGPRVRVFGSNRLTAAANRLR